MRKFSFVTKVLQVLNDQIVLLFFVYTAMGIDEVDDDDVDYNRRHDDSGTGICDVGGSGDEGGRDELLLKLQQYVTSDTNFTR